jgi:hypothetical protein
MTTLEDATTTVRAYGDTREAAGAASRQAEVDRVDTALEQANAANEELRQDVADLQRDLAAKPPTVVTEPAHPVTADSTLVTSGVQAAIDKGATHVVIRGGVLNESLGAINHPVTIQAYPGETVWLDGKGTLATTLTTNARLNLYDLGIRNFKPSAAAKDWLKAMVYFGGDSAGSIIDGCTFSDSAIDGLAIAKADISVSHCTFTSCGRTGFQANEADRLTFYANVMTRLNTAGNPAEPVTAGAKITRSAEIRVFRNTVSDVPGAYGLWLDVSCTNPAFFANEVDGSGVAGRAPMKHCIEWELSEGGTFTGNRCWGAAYAGFKVFDTGHVILRGNYLRGTQVGLWLAQDERRNSGKTPGNLSVAQAPWITKGIRIQGNDLDTIWAYDDKRVLGAADMIAELDASNKFTASTLRWGRAGAADTKIPVAQARTLLKAA